MVRKIIQPCPECNTLMNYIDKEGIWRCPKCGVEDIW